MIIETLGETGAGGGKLCDLVSNAETMSTAGDGSSSILHHQAFFDCFLLCSLLVPVLLIRVFDYGLCLRGVSCLICFISLVLFLSTLW